MPTSQTTVSMTWTSTATPAHPVASSMSTFLTITGATSFDYSAITAMLRIDASRQYSDATYKLGAGGSIIQLGAATDTVYGGSGSDNIQFGTGLATVSGGLGGKNGFFFTKGSIADPAIHGGQMDHVTDFNIGTRHDYIWLKGFNKQTTTLAYDHDISPGHHVYAIHDGVYHASIELDFAGSANTAALATLKGMWGIA